MKKTIFTSSDMKDMIEKIFNGNLSAYKASGGQIPYKNENSENILISDGDDTYEQDIAEYLNIKFYSWKNRLVESEQGSSTIDTWIESLNASMNKAYALVELIDATVTPSPDMDSATIDGRVTFLIQTDKAANLDFYVSKLRGLYLGEVQDIQNAYGDILKAYLTIGTLLYDEEPVTVQIGEVVTATMNFSLTYLTEALGYKDITISMSLDNGENYYTVPFTRISWQNIFTGQAYTVQDHPERTGVLNSSVSSPKTFSFFDFNKDLTMALTNLFWEVGAETIMEGETNIPTTSLVNIPVLLKVETNGRTYTYRDVITSMEKVISNGTFNISSLTLQGYPLR